MGERTVVKYMTLVMAFIKLASTFMVSYRNAQRENSPGGEKITQEEWYDVAIAVQDELSDSLPGMKAFVFFVPEEE